MASSETARLLASLELQDKFSPTADRVIGKVGKLDAAITRSSGRAYKAGTQIGTGIKNGAFIAAGAIGFLATNVAVGLKALEKLEVATAQTNAVIKSTKGAADQTAESIRNLAEKYESLNATIDDKVIQSGENLLLTFTNIKKDAFEPALLAALNMNQALGGGEEGLQGNIQKLGKALNDPIKGLTSLSRVGITFTAQQKEQIKAAVEAGDTFKAQGIILGELDKRFGGSFLAGGATTTGKIAKFKDSIEDLQKTLATAMLPVIGKVADALSSFLADPAVIKGAEDLGKSIAGLFSDKNLAQGADFLKGTFQTAKEAAPVVASAAKATFSMVQAAVGLFRSLPPELQKLAVGAFAVNKLTGGLVTNIAGGIIDVVGKNFLQRGGSPANPLFVADVAGGAGALPGAAGAVKSTAGKLVSAATKVFMVGAAIGVFAELKGILDEQSAANKVAVEGFDKQTKAFTGGASLADLKQSLAGVDKQISDLTHGLTPEAIAFQLDIDGVKTAVEKSRADLVAAINAQGGATGIFGKIGDTVSTALAAALEKRPRSGGASLEDRDAAFEVRKAGEKATLDARRIEAAENRTGTLIGANGKVITGSLAKLGSSFRGDINSLRAATKPFDVAKFAREIAKDVAGGKGSAKGTASVLKDLKIKLAQTDDPKTRAVLKQAIAIVAAKLPNRQFVQGKLTAANKIAADGHKSTERKLADLKEIEKSLREHGDRHAAGVVRKLEKTATAATAAGTKVAGAVNRKDLSVTVNVPAPQVSIRDFQGQVLVSAAYNGKIKT